MVQKYNYINILRFKRVSNYTFFLLLSQADAHYLLACNWLRIHWILTCSNQNHVRKNFWTVPLRRKENAGPRNFEPHPGSFAQCANGAIDTVEHIFFLRGNELHTRYWPIFSTANKGKHVLCEPLDRYTKPAFRKTNLNSTEFYLIFHFTYPFIWKLFEIHKIRMYL